MIRGCLSGFLLALGRLRSQAGLLLILLLTAAVVVVGAGPGLEALFSGEEKLTVIKLGIAGGEEEDELTRKLVSAVTLAADVSDYCSFEALSEEEGRAALERGELTALLLLPEGFVDSVLTGENLPVTLLTDGRLPLESWLIGRLGESVSRMLAAAQAGIYTVIDAYDGAELAHPERMDMIMEVNLAYMGWVTSRAELYATVRLSLSGGSLPVIEHYLFSAMAYLPLLCAALLWPAFGGKDLLGWHRRLKSVGIPPAAGAVGSIFASVLVLLPLLLLPLGLWGGLGLATVGAALLTAVTAAAFCACCCSLTSSAGGAALVSFLIGTLMLLLTGGILPGALLPEGLSLLGQWMPLGWMRDTLALSQGWEVSGGPGKLLLAALMLTGLAAWLFERRVMGEGGRI